MKGRRQDTSCPFSTEPMLQQAEENMVPSYAADIDSEKYVCFMQKKEARCYDINESTIHQLIEQGNYLQAAREVATLDLYEERNSSILSTFFTGVFTLFRDYKKGVFCQPSEISYVIQLFAEVIKILSSVHCVVSRLYFERIGELATRAGILLARRQLGMEKEKTLYLFFSGKPANRQVLDMFKRKICIVEHEEIMNYDGVDPIDFLLPQELASQFRKATSYRSTDKADHFTSNEYFEFNNTSNLLTLTDEEKERGKQILNKMGLQKDDWFVCMFARSSRYVTETFCEFAGPNVDVHNRDRNANIVNFKEAAQSIVRAGGYVIRIGKLVDEPICFANERIIDYSVSKYQSDFMDIFLLAMCKFVFGTPSGILDVSLLFDTPTLITNMVPPGHAFVGKNGLSIPKKLIDIKTKAYVPYRQAISEMRDRNNMILWDTDSLYREKGWVYEENTPEEIADAVEEMLARLDGRFIPTHQEQLDQLNYRAMISRDHWSYNVRTPICAAFIRKNRHLFC